MNISSGASHTNQYSSFLISQMWWILYICKVVEWTHIFFTHLLFWLLLCCSTPSPSSSLMFPPMVVAIICFLKHMYPTKYSFKLSIYLICVYKYTHLCLCVCVCLIERMPSSLTSCIYMEITNVRLYYYFFFTPQCSNVGYRCVSLSPSTASNISNCHSHIYLYTTWTKSTI